MTLRAQTLAEADLRGLATRLTARTPGATAWPLATGGDGAGRQVIEMIATSPRLDPLVIPMLERHPHSSQSFLALDSARWLVVLCPSDSRGEPDLTGAFALLAERGDAVCLHQGVWHAPLTVLEQPATFAMTMWRREDRQDGEVRDVAFQITL